MNKIALGLGIKTTGLVFLIVALYISLTADNARHEVLALWLYVMFNSIGQLIYDMGNNND